MGERRRDLSLWKSGLLHDITRLEWSQFDPVTGLRAAAFVVAPLVIGDATGYLFQGLFATIAANFLVNTEGTGPNATRLRELTAACLIEPAALALGTLAGSTGLLAIPLVASGVFALLIARTYPSWSQVGLLSAVVFVVGAGLPGDSGPAATERLVSAVIGDFWVLLGIWIHRSARPVEIPSGESRSGGLGSGGSRHRHPFLNDLSVHSEAFRQAAVTGLAAAVGLGIGLALSLPRDIWILITIVIAIRHGVGPTVNSTVILVLGTVVGAAIAAAVTIEISNLDALVVFLFVFAFGMFASRLVNQALVQVFLTPFLIILLNLVFPGGWEFAVYRVIDVAVGGGVAIAAAYLLCLELNITGPGRSARG